MALLLIAHLCNKGNHVIFRDSEDCINMNNKLAICAYQTRIKILAFSIMSTHIHVVVKADSRKKIDDFAKAVRKSYNITYSRKYSPMVLESLNLECHIAASELDIKNKIAYVCRNCIHHLAAVFPFAHGRF